MVPYEDFRSNALEAPIMRRWIFAGLVASLGLHAGLFYFFYIKKLDNFGPPPMEQLAPPRAFTLKQVSIPKMEDVGEPQVKSTETKKPTSASKVEIPSDKPQVTDDVRLAPQMPSLPKAMLNEKPRVESAGLDQLAKMDPGSRNALDKELNAVTQGLLKESPRSARQPLVSVGAGKLGSGAGDSSANIPGLKSLDEALASTGPLPAGDKPIGMPGGALFEYNSFDLRDESIGELRKLGTLIQRNPGATFSIEGHTDSFGPPEYNQKLSENRAEAVKAWLVQEMGISADRIQTRGYGNTKWIVSPDKTKEEQAPNRRVEIVVKTKRR